MVKCSQSTLNIYTIRRGSHLLVNCASVSMAELLLIVDILGIYLQSNERESEQEIGVGVTAGYKQDRHSGHYKFSNIRRENTETEGGVQEINTTFAVQFIKGHGIW